MEDSITKRSITYSEFIASNPNWDAELQKIADNDRLGNK